MSAKKDKSQLSIAERTKQVLRVNQENPAHALAPRSDKNPPKYVRGGTVLLPKCPGQALPHGSNLFKRDTYVVGDGERMQSGRLGADDHLQYKSRGHSV
jgi:hypothetical protein